MYDLAIIGGGPAGVTAGIYSARQKLKTILITKGFGGQMTRKAVPIENFPGLGPVSSVELISRFEKDLKKHPIEIIISQVSKIEKEGDFFNLLIEGKDKISAKSIIISSGADPRLLGIPGESEFAGRGVSYCVSCDGPIFSGKDVVVAGGGNSAFEAAISLSNYANKIYILERGEEIRADDVNQKKAKDTKKIEVFLNISIKEILGEKFVKEILCQNNKTKEEIKIKTSGIFIEIGSQPATFFVKDLVDFNNKGEIIVDPVSYRTKTNGIWAAGDVNSLPFKQIVIAAGEGAAAAMDVSNYLLKL